MLTRRRAPSPWFSWTPTVNWGGSFENLPTCLGGWLTVHFATCFIPFKQCAWCHVLSHMTNECRCPANYVHCYICRQPHHMVADHHTKCLNVWGHKGLLCDCPQKCFNCIYAICLGTGHLAIDKLCPLKKNMRHTPLLSQTSTTTNQPGAIPSAPMINTAQTPA